MAKEVLDDAVEKVITATEAPVIEREIYSKQVGPGMYKYFYIDNDEEVV